MKKAEVIETTVEDKKTIVRWMGAFLSSRGAMLTFESDPSREYPVVVVSLGSEEGLLLDTGSVPQIQAAQEATHSVQLSIFEGNDQVMTSYLPIIAVDSSQDRSVTTIAFPDSLRLLRRRAEFRAELREELACEVQLCEPGYGDMLAGRLCDLSEHGCRARLPMEAIYLDSGKHGPKPHDLTLIFPNEERVSLPVFMRHCDVAEEESLIYFGFEFADISASEERQVWRFVREIEREQVRSASGARDLQPSALFVAPARATVKSAVQRPPYATSMARQLAGVATGIGRQLRAINDGGLINSVALSRSADELLRLVKSDRQEVMFALICLPEHPALVVHCLAVAARLTDIALSLKIPHETVKAIAACALVHDLTQGLSTADGKGDGGAEQKSADLRALIDRLVGCRWLPPLIITELIEHINERDNGSGYPRGLRAGDLSELGRLAAVVDVLDWRCRGSAAGETTSYERAREALSCAESGFSLKWIDFFYHHFGCLPVGARVIDRGRRHYWVKSLSLEGACRELVPCATEASRAPSAHDLESVLTGNAVPAQADLWQLA